MQFTKLRLHGFKSFVEPTELLIEPGLTGIVGPNGCGKSNLVEALQWVMGEGSARRLRGGEMDDVIFGGTSSRPARNIANVGLWLDNRDGTATGDFAGQEELEIDRRIDRGKGSNFRVNGREARARDVQILFADAASGAQSASLIGQGRIGWLIMAKPAERRQLLEEAAGIGGLHARRREAELRLAAAETNLVRLQDIQLTLSQQIDRLRKQAKQAERYRRLSEQLRGAEALLLYRQWLDQRDRAKRLAIAFEAAEARVAETAAIVESRETARRTAHEAVPALRDAASDAARKAESLAASLLAIDAEARRVTQAIEDTRRRLAQLDQDAGREQRLAADASAARERLAAERAGLVAEQAGEAAAQQAADALLDTARQQVAAADAALATAMQEAASAEATRQAVLRRIAAIDERQRRVARQAAEAEAKSRELDLLAVSAARMEAADAAVAESEAALVAARAAIATAEEELRRTEQARQEARPRLQAAERLVVKLGAEIDALGSLAGTGPTKKFAAVLDGVTVSPGLEAALGAALGDDLFASLDSAAPIHWAALPAEEGEPDALPAGAERLATAVEAPPALARRLARIGVVPDDETGRRLQPLLRPGQRLVSREGAAWRWDGLITRPGAPTQAAVRLAQRNRLRQLEAERKEAAAALAKVQAEDAAAAAALDGARDRERAARGAQLAASQRSVQARQDQLSLRQMHGQAQERQKSAAELRDRLTAELAEIAAQAADAERERTGLPDTAQAAQRVQTLRAEVARLRETEALHRRESDRIARDAATRARRIEAIDGETRSWHERETAAAAQRAALAGRRAELDGEAQQLAERPAALAAERTTTDSALTEARAESGASGEKLRAAEAHAAAADLAHADATRIHGEARENRVRAEAQHEQAVEALAAASARAREPFECPAEQLPRVAGVPVAATDEPVEALEQRFDRLRRDREAIGPVNLMAESEMTSMEAELATIRTESEDLVAAIARLRQGIQQLNREGRERLAKAFDAVNEHFQALFVRLFGGGHAHLELTQTDGDPLSAGLEIMASPPGKKLQSLSLLSGGERALTALALVFAVFLTNPAPVCVLDEVDAPLDDANVERFCALVREIGDRTLTRFLVITHHRVTMARMDRLYGVTMVERGVSQLVSVELQTAEQLRRTA